MSEITQLIEKFKSPKWIDRKIAAEEIAKKYGEKALNYLIEEIDSRKDEDKVFWSIRTLALIGSKKAVSKLLMLVEDNSSSIRQWVAVALGDLKKNEVIPVLINLLNDDDWQVAYNASSSLIRFGSIVIKPITERLKKAGYNYIYWATQTIGQLGDAGIKVLIKFLSFATPTVKTIVLDSIGSLRDKRVVRFIVNTLLDDSWNVRSAAVDALVRMGQIVVEPLIYLLKEGKNQIYEQVKEVFSKLGVKKIDKLLNLLSHPDPEVRILAAHFLYDVDEEEVILTLIDALDDPVWIVKKEVSKTLVAIGQHALPFLIKKLEIADNNKAFWLIHILGQLGKESSKILVRLLKTGSKYTRKYAALALGETFDRDIVTPLIESLADEEWIVRSAAAESLKKLGGIILFDLIRYYQVQDDNVRFWVKKILDEIGKDNVRYLLEKLNSQNKEERQLATYGVGILKIKQAVNNLIDLLFNDLDEWVKKYAAFSLAQIRTKEAIEALFLALDTDDDEFAAWIISNLKDVYEEEEVKNWIINTIFETESVILSFWLIATVMQVGDITTAIEILDSEKLSQEKVKYLAANLNKVKISYEIILEMWFMIKNTRLKSAFAQYLKKIFPIYRKKIEGLASEGRQSAVAFLRLME